LQQQPLWEKKFEASLSGQLLQILILPCSLWFALKRELSSLPHNSHLAVAITAIPGRTLLQVYNPIPIGSMNTHIKLYRYIRFSEQEA
jgi:hypothetical protein